MNLFQLFKNVSPFVKPYKWLVFITLVLTLVGSLMAQVNAIVLDWTVDQVNGLVTAGENWGQAAAHIIIMISVVLLGKEIISALITFAQNYFAVQTRRAELVEQRLLDYERVKARAKLAETEKILSGVLYERGVDSKGFAIIRSKGDKALFHIDTKLLKRKYNAPDSRPLADFLPTISIKAKDLAAEMTSINVQTKDLYGQTPIEKEHIDNNTAVRDMLVSRGIYPEELPPAEDVKKVERRLAKDDKSIK